MPQKRSEPEPDSPRISLHIGASAEAAWENVVLPWFEKIHSRGLANGQPVAVVTPSRSQAYFFRNQLLAAGKSLLGLKFLSPPQLREHLLRNCALKVPLREHLRLLLAATAEQFAADKIDPPSLDASPARTYGVAGNEEVTLIAKSIARDPDHFLRALDQLGAAGWSFDEVDSAVLQ